MLLTFFFFFVGSPPGLGNDQWSYYGMGGGNWRGLSFFLFFVEPGLDLNPWIKKRLVGGKELERIVFYLSFCRTCLGLGLLNKKRLVGGEDCFFSFFL